MNAIIVSVTNKKTSSSDYFLEETINLCEACEIAVVDCITQNLDKKDNKFYIGSGKLSQLYEMITDKIDLVVVNDDISGSINKNLEQYLNVKVIDRTGLILEIFSRRAKSKESILQVEIAKLKYQKNRMVGKHTNLDRQVSGSGFFSRGSGETRLETERRTANKKISDYENQLKKFVKTRNMQRKRRKTSSILLVAICGYTNAGKSSLVNSLAKSEKQVLEKDMLFASIDTNVRKVELPSGLKFLVVDTVGFVSNLSHDLIKAFRSTLEEIEHADLIINLCDISNKNFAIQEKVVSDTLSTLNTDHIEKVTVYNKIDKVHFFDDISIAISAKNGTNIEILQTYIEQKLFSNYKKVELEIPHHLNYYINELQEYTYVNNIKYKQSCVCFNTMLSPKDYQKLKGYIKKEG